MARANRIASFVPVTETAASLDVLFLLISAYLVFFFMQTGCDGALHQVADAAALV
jgi:hypothetical protein